MPAERIQGQTITLTDGTKVSGKTVRRADYYGVYARLGGSWPGGQRVGSGTFGTAKVNGFEIPVRRTRGRYGPWIQTGIGRKNDSKGYQNYFNTANPW